MGVTRCCRQLAAADEPFGSSRNARSRRPAGSGRPDRGGQVRLHGAVAGAAHSWIPRCRCGRPECRQGPGIAGACRLARRALQREERRRCTAKRRGRRPGQSSRCRSATAAISIAALVPSVKELYILGLKSPRCDLLVGPAEEAPHGIRTWNSGNAVRSSSPCRPRSPRSRWPAPSRPTRKSSDRLVPRRPSK